MMIESGSPALAVAHDVGAPTGPFGGAHSASSQNRQLLPGEHQDGWPSPSLHGHPPCLDCLRGIRRA